MHVSLGRLQLFDPLIILDDSRGENDPGAAGGGNGKVLPRDEEVLVDFAQVVDLSLCSGRFHGWLLAWGVSPLYHRMG